MCRPKLRLPPKTISVRNVKHFDRSEFFDDLKLAHFDEIKNYSNDANEMLLLWKSFYIDILNKHAPVTNIRLKTIFHQAEFSARSDILFCLKIDWRRVGVKRQKKISFRVENCAK